eukprot:TRINITY_DN26390_c0_g1_i1.p1 TRINITY_DN26390_c0_g1~~TRINITY_DN26390_c0_g1_i1.p1  ORF type:complete len:1889 (+),score=346.57 TRINITY_DN26390_c0_g1_i1:123-5789(+)
MAEPLSPKSPKSSGPLSPKSPGQKKNRKGSDQPWEEVRIPAANIPELRVALKTGGGVKAAYDVGQFREGFTLLAGGNLDLQAFDVFGLEEGDDIDTRLRGVVQEALAALADDRMDAKLRARPPWIVADTSEQTKGGFCRCCRRKPKKYKWNRSWLDRLTTLYIRLERFIMGIVYGMQTGGKKYDVFVSFRSSDADLGSWMKNFCTNRSISMYCEPPVAAAEQLIDSLDDTELNRFRQSIADGNALKTEELLIQQLLRVRQEEVSAARLLIVVLGDESPFDSFWLLLDCVFACAAGVPILPVRRATETAEQSIPMLKKQLPCAFELGLDPPTAGSGASRQVLGIVVSRSVVKGLRAAKKKKATSAAPATSGVRSSLFSRRSSSSSIGSTSSASSSSSSLSLDLSGAGGPFVPPVPLPLGIPELAIEACRLLQRDAEIAEQNDLQVAAKAKEAEMLAFLEAPLAGGKKTKRKQKKADLIKQAHDHNQAPKDTQVDERWSHPDTQERVYGVLAILAYCGESQRRLSIDGTDALLQLSRGEKGSTWIAKFGGVDVLIRLAQLALERRTETVGGRRTSAKFVQKSIKIEKRRWWHRCFPCCKRKRDANEVDVESGVEVLRTTASGSTDEQGRLKRWCFCCRRARSSEESSEIDSARSAPGTPVTARSQWSQNSGLGQRPSLSRRGSFSGAGDVSPISPESRYSNGSGGMRMSRRQSLEGEGFALGRRPSMASISEQPVSRRSSRMSFLVPAWFQDLMGKREIAGDAAVDIVRSGTFNQTLEEFPLAEFTLAALKNLACRSEERKVSVVARGAAKLALRTLDTFRQESGIAVRRQAACLLRNISHGAQKIGVIEDCIPWKEMLDVAEKELQVPEDSDDPIQACPTVRRHLLAMIQNLFLEDGICAAAHLLAEPGQSVIVHWIDVCLKSCAHAWKHKEYRIVHQACLCLANFALRRFEEYTPPKLDGSEHSSKSAKSERSVLVAPEVEGNNEEEEKASSRSAKSAASWATSSGASWPSAESSAKGGAGEGEGSKQKGSDSSEDKEMKASAASSDTKGDGGWGASGSGEGKASASSSSDTNGDGGWGASAKGSSDSDGWKESGEDNSWNESSGSWDEGDDGSPTSKRKSEESQSSAETDSDLESTSSARHEVDASINRAGFKFPKEGLSALLDILVKMGAEDKNNEKEKGRVSMVASVLSCLCNLAHDTDVEQLLGFMGSIPIVLHTIKHYHSVEIHLEAMRFLWNMTCSHSNQKRLIKEDGLTVVYLLLSHRSGAELGPLCEQCCGVMRNLSQGRDKIKRLVFDAGFGRVLTKCLEDFANDTSARCQITITLRVLANEAPPVLKSLIEFHAVERCLQALEKSHATDHDQKSQVQLLEFLTELLVLHIGQQYFQKAQGYVQLQRMLKSCTDPVVSSRICWTLASSLATAPAEATMLLNYSPDHSEAEEERAMDTSKQKNERPRLLVRAGLIEMQTIELLVHICEQWHELELYEGAAALTLNLVVDEDLGNGQREHMEAKTDTANKLAKIFFDAALQYIELDQKQASAKLAALVLKVMGSLALDAHSALFIFRTHVHEKVVIFMRAFEDNAAIQTAACMLITNLAASPKLRIRSALLQASDTIEAVALVVGNHKEDQVPVSSALLAFANLSSAGIDAKVAKQMMLVDRISAVVDIHGFNAVLQERAFGALRNATMTDEVCQELFKKQGVELILDTLFTYRTNSRVLLHTAGVLRNALASSVGHLVSYRVQCIEPKGREGEQMDGSFGSDKNDEVFTGGGYKLILDILCNSTQWVECEEQLYAVVANILEHGGDHVEKCTEQLMVVEQKDNFRACIEKYPQSEMLQYQGLSAFSKMLAFKADLAYLYPGFGEHVKNMMAKYNRTPIADIGELLLEQLK